MPKTKRQERDRQKDRQPEYKNKTLYSELFFFFLLFVLLKNIMFIIAKNCEWNWKEKEVCKLTRIILGRWEAKKKEKK